MQKTRIEWVKNPDGTQGYTWNPITGCLNGCEYCYARKLANGRLRDRYLANDNISPIQTESPGYYTSKLIDNLDPFYPRFWEDRLDDLPTNKLMVPWSKDKGIFVCDMGELFGDWVPNEWQVEIFAKIEAYSWHRFYLLTKQPQNLVRFSPFPDNCWVGVTATNQVMYDSAVYHLNRIKARVTYISLEPLLSHINLPNYKDVDWLIVGVQTRPYKPPKMKWIDEIVRTCDKAGIPVFLKNNLQPLVDEVFKGARVYSSPILTPDNKLRQEFPK